MGTLPIPISRPSDERFELLTYVTLLLLTVEGKVTGSWPIRQIPVRINCGRTGI